MNTRVLTTRPRDPLDTLPRPRCEATNPEMSLPEGQGAVRCARRASHIHDDADHWAVFVDMRGNETWVAWP